jgi:hypothetical protein
VRHLSVFDTCYHRKGCFVWISHTNNWLL